MCKITIKSVHRMCKYKPKVMKSLTYGAQNNIICCYELHNIHSLFLYEDKFSNLWQYIVKKGSLWKYLLSIISLNDNTITRGGRELKVIWVTADTYLGINTKETRNNRYYDNTYQS